AHLYLHSFPTRRSSDLGDQRLSPVRSEGGRKDGTDHDRWRLDRPVPSTVAGAKETALGSQKQMVGVSWTDCERNGPAEVMPPIRSEEHTSELQSLTNLV